MSTTSDGFIGRGREIGQVLTLLLRRARLITLLGAGGIGKTALAAEAVARYRASTGATVHWVGLARLQAGADESAVLDEIAQVVLEADAAEACTTRQAVVNALEQANPTGHGPETILVLDNCEHVAAAAGQVIADVLAAVGSVCVLATSRRPIGWVDEHRVAVPPLSCADAVELFRRRALLAGKPLPESDYEESVAAICRRLHNHPLYLRLAAARLVRQPLATILSDLATEPEADRRLAWTTSATIGVDARHHGVGDAIGWSYRLCSDVERLLFERMSVFAAGYDIDNRSVTPESGVELEAVEQVCADQEGRPGGGLTRDTVEEVLHGLADQSLVTVHWSPTVVRYSLVESLRVYARQRLRERGSDEITNVTESYVRYYRSRVAGVAAGWCGPDGAAMLQWAQQAWPNIRTAVELAAAEPDTAEVGLEMCALLFESRIAYLKGGFRATKLMTERALHVCGARPTPLRQRTIAKLALMAVYAGELDNAEELLGRCVLDAAADMPPARWQDSPHLDLGLSAAAEFAWGNLLLSGRDARAGMVFQRAAAKFTAAGAAGPAIQAALVATFAAVLLGSAHDAESACARFRAQADASGSEWARGWAGLLEAMALTRRGRVDEALDRERRCLTVLLAAREQFAAMWAVHLIAWTLGQKLDRLSATAGSGRVGTVSTAVAITRLLGGAAQLRRWLHVDIHWLGGLRSELEASCRLARKVLGPDRYDAVRAQGAALRAEAGEIHQLALGTLPAERPAPPSGEWQQLTDAERDVAILAAAGWTNSAIAIRRGTARKTVDAQMMAILAKLAVTSRADIQAQVPPADHPRLRTESSHRPLRADPLRNGCG